MPMLTVHYLGTGAAVPAPGRDNTSLALDDGREVTLIDTSGSPLKRLGEAGLDPDRLSRVIITHEHLDHTFGYPSLLQSLWLCGRKAPLDVYAQTSTWRVLDGLTTLYRADRWKEASPVIKHVIEPGDGPLFETEEISVRAGRGQHSVPSVGVRVKTTGGNSLVYSSDTSPSESIRELARDADVLIHEATFVGGKEPAANRLGHSTARQAAEIAVAANVKRLVLIHFTPSKADDLVTLRRDAEEVFKGPIDVPSDLETLTLGHA
jgi:ribonuclease Z